MASKLRKQFTVTEFPNSSAFVVERHHPCGVKDQCASFHYGPTCLKKESAKVFANGMCKTLNACNPRIKIK